MDTTDTVVPLMPEFHCLACGSKDGQVRIDEVEFAYGRGRQQVTLVAHTPVHSCHACGQDIVDQAGEQAKQTAICRYLGILTPTEIGELRSGLGLSREELSKLTGLGTASLARWESGTHPQNTASDRLLRLLSVPGVISALRNMMDTAPQKDSPLPQLRALEVSDSVLVEASQFKLA